MVTCSFRCKYSICHFIISFPFRPGMSAKLRMIVQHGLNTLRAGEKNGLQPALAIHWAQCLSQTVHMHTYKHTNIYTVHTQTCTVYTQARHVAS